MVATTNSYKDLENLPSLAAVATLGTYASLTGQPDLAPVATAGTYASLKGQPNLAPVATVGTYASLTGQPNLALVATSGQYADVQGTPVLAPVATIGTYDSLTGQPNLAPVATAGTYASLTERPNFAPVATAGTYASLTGLPPLVTPSGWITATLNSGITNSGGTTSPASYALSVTGTVLVRGCLTGASTNSTLFTLPVGYRPRYTVSCTAWGVGAGLLGATNTIPVMITINTSGTVVRRIVRLHSETF